MLSLLVLVLLLAAVVLVWLCCSFCLLFLLLVFFGGRTFGGVRSIPYSEFKAHLERSEVVQVQVRESELTGTLRPAGETDEEGQALEVAFRTVRIETTIHGDPVRRYTDWIADIGLVRRELNWILDEFLIPNHPAQERVIEKVNLQWYRRP